VPRKWKGSIFSEENSREEKAPKKKFHPLTLTGIWETVERHQIPLLPEERMRNRVQDIILNYERESGCFFDKMCQGEGDTSSQAGIYQLVTRKHSTAKEETGNPSSKRGGKNAGVWKTGCAKKENFRREKNPAWKQPLGGNRESAGYSPRVKKEEYEERDSTGIITKETGVQNTSGQQLQRGKSLMRGLPSLQGVWKGAYVGQEGCPLGGENS